MVRTSILLVLGCPGRASVPLEGLKFESRKLGRDERLARPRMTGTVIRTFDYFAVP